MSYIAPVKVEDPIRYYTDNYPAAINPRYATEAAQILLARSS